MAAERPSFTVGAGDYTLVCVPDGLPFLYGPYVENAALTEALDVGEGETCCVAVKRRGDSWPFLVVAQGFRAAGGFWPGALLVPETSRLFVGAGTRLLAYDLAAPRRLWEAATDVGFWRWERHGDVVLMSAELELAAYDLGGARLWTTPVEPPWRYEVRGQELYLDVMGRLSDFPLYDGP